MPADLQFNWQSMIELVLEVLASHWVRQVGVLLAATAVSWPFAHWIARRLRFDDPDERRELRILRQLVHAAVWPVLALGLSAVTLEVWRSLSPESLGESEGVLPILVFFLVLRLVNRLLRELVPPGAQRKRVRKGLVPSLFVLLVLQQLGLLGPLLEILQRPIINAGDAQLTVMSILVAIAVLIGASIGGQILQALLGRRVLPRLGVDVSVAEAVATVLRYVLVVVGLVWALEVIGFDLTTLKIAFGAMGVGIGFGLQNIVNNFTSGLILLFERTVKRGDVLTVEGTHGRVQSVGLRASIIRTRSGDDLILPNSILVETMVTNHNYGDSLKRVDVDVGVSYDADPNAVRELLLKVAEGLQTLKKSPKPTVLLRGFGDNSVDFQLRGWISNAWDVPSVRSQLLFDVWYALAEAGIEIPFPQRDLHIRSGELPIRTLPPVEGQAEG